jgi:DNA-binding CsgD family transcriptional regulator
VSLAAEALWELREVEHAEDLLTRALALIDADLGDWDMISNDLTAARLLAVLGRFEEAAGHFNLAREALGEQERWPLRAIVDHDEMMARRRMGKPGASRLLAAANRQFAELGMIEWSGRAARHEAPAAKTPDDLTPREAVVLRLVAAGSSNKEIAGVLGVSVHTVERHITNAYRKIGVRNRAEATAYVMENDS